MTALSSQMFSVDNELNLDGNFLRMVQFTANVKDLILCHFIKLNALIKRIKIFQKQQEYDWLQDQQKVALNSEFYSYLKRNTKMLSTDMHTLDLSFMQYSDVIQKFTALAENRSDPVEDMAFSFNPEVGLNSLLKGDGFNIPVFDMKQRQIFDDIRRNGIQETQASIELMNAFYKRNHELLTNLKENHEGVFLQADDVIKEMRKQF